MAAIPPDYALDYKVIAYVATDFAERLMAYNKRRETAHRLAYEAYLRNCTPEP